MRVDVSRPCRCCRDGACCPPFAQGNMQGLKGCTSSVPCVPCVSPKEAPRALRVRARRLPTAPINVVGKSDTSGTNIWLTSYLQTGGSSTITPNASVLWPACVQHVAATSGMRTALHSKFSLGCALQAPQRGAQSAAKHWETLATPAVACGWLALASRLCCALLPLPSRGLLVRGWRGQALLAVLLCPQGPWCVKWVLPRVSHRWYPPGAAT